jgi:hypothetical protein
MRGKVFAFRRVKRTYTVKALRVSLQKFLRRVAVINTSPEYPDFISCAKIISEYSFPLNGDGLKIVYCLQAKPIPEEKYNLLCNIIRAKANRPFSNYVDKLFYPEQFVHKYLKSRSPVLKLQKLQYDKIKEIKGHIIISQ